MSTTTDSLLTVQRILGSLMLIGGLGGVIVAISQWKSDFWEKGSENFPIMSGKAMRNWALVGGIVGIGYGLVKVLL